MNRINKPEQSKNSYWDYLPSRYTILGGATLAATIIAGSVFAFACFSPDSNDSLGLAFNKCSEAPNAHDNSSSAALEIIGNSAIFGLNGLGALGSLAAGAYVNRMQGQEAIEKAEDACSRIERFELLITPKLTRQAKSSEGAFEKPLVQKEEEFQLEEAKNCPEKLKEAKKTASICKAFSIPYHPFKLRKHKDLESNLRLGFEVLLDTLDTIRISPNYLARSKEAIEKQAKEAGVHLNDFSKIKKDLICLSDMREFTFYQEVRCQERLMEGRAISQFAKAKITVAAANHIPMGNCEEMSRVALFKAMELGAWNIHVDIISIEGGEHYAIVIGREFGSDPENYKTWGSSAVVVDAWAGKIFKLSEVEENLKDYLGTNFTTGEPLLRPFDPEKQKLTVQLGNIYSTKELINQKKTDVNHLDFMLPSRKMNKRETQLYDEAIEGLNRFHQTEILAQKLAEAKKISKICRQPEIRFFKPIKMLIDQIEHFIELNH